MAVYLYGNVNGTYQRPDINLFEMAKRENVKPIRFCDTDKGKEIQVLKVNISEEGLRALHGSQLKGSVDVKKAEEELKYISEHQPVESFTNRLSRALQNSYLQSSNGTGKEISIQEKAEVLQKEFENISDEIVAGHDDGSRVRFIADETSEDGYRKLGKEDELSILLDEFQDFLEKRLCKQNQEESISVAENLMKVAAKYVHKLMQ